MDWRKTESGLVLPARLHEKPRIVRYYDRDRGRDRDGQGPRRVAGGAGGPLILEPFTYDNGSPISGVIDLATWTIAEETNAQIESNTLLMDFDKASANATLAMYGNVKDGGGGFFTQTKYTPIGNLAATWITLGGRYTAQTNEVVDGDPSWYEVQLHNTGSDIKKRTATGLVTLVANFNPGWVSGVEQLFRVEYTHEDADVRIKVFVDDVDTPLVNHLDDGTSGGAAIQTAGFPSIISKAISVAGASIRMDDYEFDNL
jgi:hypothetical protein